MSNKENKNQKETPTATDRYAAPMFEDQDEFDIDVALKKELAEAGLEYRFIDFKQARLNGGRSRAGWIVYKRKSPDPRLQGIEALADPDGMVRQGSMVLAVKPTAYAQRQRDRRDAQNTTLKRYTENVTNELSEQARTRLGGSKIIAGYDKNS